MDPLCDELSEEAKQTLAKQFEVLKERFDHSTIFMELDQLDRRVCFERPPFGRRRSW